jgi:hypothetical protein
MLILTGLWLLDRLGCWMEHRGWIYWRRNRGSDGRLGQAFITVHSLLEPDKRHIRQVEEKQAGAHRKAESSAGVDNDGQTD